jgi:hypothetical protein
MMKPIYKLLVCTFCALGFSDSETFTVIFPDEKKTKVTVDLIDGVGRKEFDAVVEYAIEFNEGKPTKREKRGLGYFINIQVVERREAVVICTIEVAYCFIADWIPYDVDGSAKVWIPVFSSGSGATELILPIGEWLDPASKMDVSGLEPFDFNQTDDQNKGLQRTEIVPAVRRFQYLFESKP